jgi:hypothetical protein
MTKNLNHSVSQQCDRMTKYMYLKLTRCRINLAADFGFAHMSIMLCEGAEALLRVSVTFGAASNFYPYLLQHSLNRVLLCLRKYYNYDFDLSHKWIICRCLFFFLVHIPQHNYWLRILYYTAELKRHCHRYFWGCGSNRGRVCYDPNFVLTQGTSSGSI